MMLIRILEEGWEEMEEKGDDSGMMRKWRKWRKWRK
jgi:hypothetical protein